jgi:hypothetical protein
MVDMRQRYVVVICVISQILQMSLQCSTVCLLCLIYLFVALLKARHIIPKIVKIVSICSVQTDQVHLRVCVCMLS